MIIEHSSQETMELLERLELLLREKYDAEESPDADLEEFDRNWSVVVLCIRVSRGAHLIEWYTSGFE